MVRGNGGGTGGGGTIRPLPTGRRGKTALTFGEIRND